MPPVAELALPVDESCLSHLETFVGASERADLLATASSPSPDDDDDNTICATSAMSHNSFSVATKADECSVGLRRVGGERGKEP